MGYDDLFENNHGHHKQYSRYVNDDHRYLHDKHDSNDYYHSYNKHFNWMVILEKIRGNNRLKGLVIIAGISVLLIGIILIIILLPVIMKLINALTQTGLQGIAESISDFLNKLWNGSAN
jgi:hypothetical protein